MAHPKRRQSKTRTAKRRTHDKAVAPKWHILREDNQKQELQREELMIKQ
ncbi:50S ribosomal protein L32 [Bacteroides fragilis CAG:558]|nr:50S ribosomal protein L32 [Bacteroides fragilis CAG:558]